MARGDKGDDSAAIDEAAAAPPLFCRVANAAAVANALRRLDRNDGDADLAAANATRCCAIEEDAMPAASTTVSRRNGREGGQVFCFAFPKKIRKSEAK